MKQINSYKIPIIVKWAGGKTQLLEQLNKFFPKKIENYYEPFAGGGAVFFYIKQKFKPKKIIISDINKDLINTYLQVKSNTNELLKLLRIHQKKHSKQYYYQIRDRFNNNKKLTVQRAADFIYLNHTCFNGLYRVNSKGKFNVPIGSYKNPTIADEKRLKRASKLLQGVIIKCQDYKEMIKNISDKTFIYLDPPYYPLNNTSNFTSYTSNGFGKREQKKLAIFFNELSKRGAKGMLSNSNTDFIKGLYFNFGIHEVLAKRAINSKAEGRGAISELLITNY